MNIWKSSLFPFIQGDSLVGRSVTLTMTTVKDEELTNASGKTDIKPVLRFKETSKGLVLNKTNVKAIAKHYGGETETWAGKQITLYSERVKAFGAMHNAVRVKANGKGKPEAIDPVDLYAPGAASGETEAAEAEAELNEASQ